MNTYLEGEKYWELTIIWEKPMNKWRRVVLTKCNCWVIQSKWIWTISTNLNDWITNYCWLVDKHRQITWINYRAINRVMRLKKKERQQKKVHLEEIDVLVKKIKNERIEKEKNRDKILLQSAWVLIWILIVGLIFLFTVWV